MPYLCAGRQIAPSCVDADESLSAIGLHVEVAAASPAQEELQFCLTAAQQPRPHCSSVSHRIGISPKVPLHRGAADASAASAPSLPRIHTVQCGAGLFHETPRQTVAPGTEVPRQTVALDCTGHRSAAPFCGTGIGVPRIRLALDCTEYTECQIPGSCKGFIRRNCTQNFVGSTWCFQTGAIIIP